MGVCDTQDALAASGLHECGQKHSGKAAAAAYGFSSQRAHKKQIQGRLCVACDRGDRRETGARSISKLLKANQSQISQSALDLNIAMDGRDARIAAKRARKQKEAEEAAAYERLKQELADRRACIPPTRDPRGTHVGPRRPSQSYDPIWDPRGASRIRGG